MDGPGRAQAPGIGVGKADQGLDAALRGVLGVPSQRTWRGRSLQGRDCPGGRHLGGDFETPEAGEDIGDEEEIMEEN